MHLLSYFSVFITTALLVLVLAKWAPKLQLLAIPGEHRQHQKPTPMVGGLAIFGGLLVSLIFDTSHLALFTCLSLLCCVGALDDRYALPSWSRFLVQGVAAYLMIRLTGVSLVSLGNLLSPDATVLLGRWSTAMTIFAVIGVINAVNMSDGLDGLAGSLIGLALVALLIFGHPSPNFIGVSLAAIAGFLIWNLRVGRASARVFMGDAGSTMLGLLLAYLLIRFSQTEAGIAPITALWLMALPLIDAVAVLIVRPLRGKSPFAADRAHYHHQLLDRGLSVNRTLIIAVTLQAAFVVLGLIFHNLGTAEFIQLRLFLFIFVAYLASLFWFTRRAR